MSWSKFSKKCMRVQSVKVLVTDASWGRCWRWLCIFETRRVRNPDWIINDWVSPVEFVIELLRLPVLVYLQLLQNLTWIVSNGYSLQRKRPIFEMSLYERVTNNAEEDKLKTSQAITYCAINAVVRFHGKRSEKTGIWGNILKEHVPAPAGEALCRRRDFPHKISPHDSAGMDPVKSSVWQAWRSESEYFSPNHETEIKIF